MPCADLESEASQNYRIGSVPQFGVELAVIRTVAEVNKVV